MAVTLQHERDNIYRLDISGRLRKDDLAAMEQRAAGEIRRTGRIRLLVVLTQFDGWDNDTSWRDLSFYIQHGGAIERIAIVGDERWRSEALMFAGADLRDAPVAFFPVADSADARSWVAG